jgi:hypothetical protein
MSNELKPMIQLREEELDRIQADETQKIMAMIRPQPSKIGFTKTRWLLVSLCTFIVALIVSLTFLLRPTDEFSMADFYSNLTQYRDRMIRLIGEEDVDLSTLAMTSAIELDMSLLTTYRRDDVLQQYEQTYYDHLERDYLDNLSTTREWMDEIVAIVDNHQNIVLGEPYSPDASNPDLTYRFMMSDAVNIIIDKRDGQSFSYIKMGVDQELLSYNEIHYRYDLTGDTLSIADSLIYFYFRFIENQEAVYINSAMQESSMRFTSIVSGQSFTIASGTTIVESGENRDAFGYFLNAYDPEANFTVSMEVVDEIILSESYQVFSPHDLLYSYADSDLLDDRYEFAFNLIPATGWDYVVVSEGGSSPEVIAARGVYRDDNTRLYDGHMNYAVTPINAYIGIRAEYQGEINEETFLLDEFGLELNDPQFTLASFQELRISSFEEMKTAFQIPNLDFFDEDLRGELYRYLDADIRASIEGEDLDYETTGDVDEFLEATATFGDHLATQGSFIDSSQTMIDLYDGATLISSIPTESTISVDFNAMYYRAVNTLKVSPYTREEQYYLIVNDDLIRMDVANQIIEYQLLVKNAGLPDFIRHLPVVNYDNPLQGMDHIEAGSGRSFDITINLDFFPGDADMNIVFEQLGFSGLDEANLTLRYEFDADYQGYTSTLIIEGLTMEEYDVVYRIVSDVKIMPISITNPLDSDQYTMFLPEDIADIIIDSPLNQTNRYYMRENPAYARVNLEAGDYYINYYGNMTEITMQILDSEYQEVVFGQYLHIEEAGTYYLRIESPYEQGIEFEVTKVIFPTEFDVLFVPEGGTIHIDNFNELTHYTFHFPSLEEATYMVVTVNEPTGNEARLSLKMVNHFLDFNYGMNLCNFDDNREHCYFYVEAGYDEPVTLFGNFVGVVDFDYEFLPLSAFPSEVTVDNLSDCPVLMISADHPELRVTFTVTEAITTRVRLDVIGLYASYLNVHLYNSQGDLLNQRFVSFSSSLSPGTYTIVIFYDRNESPPMGLIRPYFPS